MDERLPLYLWESLGSNCSLSGLIFAGLGFALGYRSFGLLQPSLLDRSYLLYFMAYQDIAPHLARKRVVLEKRNPQASTGPLALVPFGPLHPGRLALMSASFSG
ncbi:MAG: hypothetical protein PHQ39_09770 [Methanothrix soehngenii]|nr:hypothetical protein [Methanothrix soehngenii]